MKGNAKILLAAAQTLVAGAAFCGGFAGYEDAEDMPGAVSMIWTGREMLVETSGYADIAAKRPISTNDVFWVASNTKAISCALMLRLVDRGLVGLDRPVADYIPEWKGIRLKDGKAPSHAPTVRETMGHTAGLAFFPKMPITQYSVQELARMAAKDGLDHDVGEYLYSNWGIDVAMAVVERVTGKPWEEMLETEVLQPLGMADTVFFPSEEVVKTRLAKAYRLDPYHDGVAPKEETIDQLVYPYNTAGSHAEAGGGLFSTAPDLMRFFRMVAAKGVLPDGRRFISEGLLREWYGLTDYFRNRKYSFGMDIDPEHRFVRHGGAYGTDGAANWERGTARVFMTQVAMWTARTMSRRRNWEDYAAQWLGVGADRVLRVDAAAFGASPSASAETNANAIQRAIDDCASTGGEGVVTLPKGTVKTLPYVLKPRVRLACEEESRLEVVTNALFFASAEPSMGGKWICALSGQGNYRPAMRLATDVVVTQAVKRATLRATALGLYVPFVNGREITSRRLMPGWTQYEHRVPSQEFDVTSFLIVGTNCVAALVGDGWYCGQISYVGRPQGEAGWGRYPCFRAELTLEYANGSVARLGTSAKAWRSFYLNPATLVNDIYQGEEYDALMDDARWKRIGSVGGEVREAVRNVEVVGDIGQPVEVTRVIRPVKIVRRPVGTYLLDFGENVAGVERIRLKKAHRGASIVVRHGEDLDANGNLWRDNLAFAGAKTVLHCGEAAPFEYAPRFTFYGFRYAEVSGWPADEELTDESVTVEVLSSAVRETGGFECSNEQINQLFANVRRSQQANFIDVPTDCPQRCERFGWTGDAQIFAETAMMNYDVRRFFAKWLGDVRLCRSTSGAFPDIAPFPPSGTDAPAATGTAGWSDVGVVCPWMLYRKYGDRDALREAYPSIVKYVDLIASAEKLGTIGDHLNLGQPTSADYVAEALRIEMHRLAALAARALGETEDAKRFAVRREQLLAQFRTKHLGVDGLPKERTQTAAAFSLVYGIAPGEAARRKTVGLLKELIAERDGHLATGFLGTPVLLKALAGAGEVDAAYRLLETETFPGWLYPVTQGATTVWERWDAKVDGKFNSNWMNSLNHYAYGSVVAWFYDTICGIRDLTEENPEWAGFRRFRLQPQPGGTLSYAKATHEIPGGGVISSAWELKGGSVEWVFEVPEGTEAEVVFPGQLQGPLPSEITEVGGRLVARPGRYCACCAAVDLFSGRSK